MQPKTTHAKSPALAVGVGLFEMEFGTRAVRFAMPVLLGTGVWF